MPLNMTKIAYGAEDLQEVQRWFAGPEDIRRVRTRYLPKRHAEMVGGSLFWVHQHAIVGRSPITGFEQRPDGHWDILLENRFILVHPRAKRAHQGWRYLEEDKAPQDLADGDMEGDPLPGKLVRELSRLGLV